MSEKQLLTRFFLSISSILRTEAVSSSETFVYRSTQHHIPEDKTHQLLLFKAVAFTIRYNISDYCNVRIQVRK
jgi:hypothetical protein